MELNSQTNECAVVARMNLGLDPPRKGMQRPEERPTAKGRALRRRRLQKKMMTMVLTKTMLVQR